VKTEDIFRFVDLCIQEGYFPEINDFHYALLLVWGDGSKCEIRRAMVSVLLPTPCRVWLVKGRIIHLLGESFLLPLDLSSGVGPPYIGV
jgi:hypothetical protein